jgi:uncharacterized protein YkwD
LKRSLNPPAVVVVLLAALLAAGRAPANSDLVSELQSLRARGCDGDPVQPPALRQDPALDRAASALASGRRFKDAMAQSGYRAVQSTVLQVSGADDAAIARALAERGCREIADPVWRDVGVASGKGVGWIVLAAPLAPPADAGAVSERVLALVNKARASARRCGRDHYPAVAPLLLSTILGRAALAHATDMAEHSLLTHKGSDGSTHAERATRVGYRWRHIGENIAAGQTTPEQVVAEWLGSAEHCANIMDPEYAQMGVAFAADPNSEKGIYWTQLFGTRAP